MNVSDGPDNDVDVDNIFDFVWHEEEWSLRLSFHDKYCKLPNYSDTVIKKRKLIGYNIWWLYQQWNTCLSKDWKVVNIRYIFLFSKKIGVTLQNS